MVGVSSTSFPLAPRGTLGYDAEEVDRAFRVARQRYDNFDNGTQGKRLSTSSIRHTAFTMRKGGYSAPHVDAALERLEDAVAIRERDEHIERVGREVFLRETKTTARAVLARLRREDGERFDRVSVLQRGYDVMEVDEFSGRLADFLRGGTAMSLREVRGVAFTPKRHGYKETQVDLLIDAVIDVMLAIR
jgi:DivIVA domain-containing protein